MFCWAKREAERVEVELEVEGWLLVAAERPGTTSRISSGHPFELAGRGEWGDLRSYCYFAGLMRGIEYRFSL